MAKLVLTDAFISINSEDISDHVESVTVEYSADQVETTAFGDGTHIRAGGLKDWTVTLQAQDDFASSELDSVLFPLVGTTFTVMVRPVKTGGVSSTNPNFTGTGLLTGYSPVAGGVGELAKTPITIVAAGALSRATS